ncbi:MAG: imidazole glycerol phosphate synthase subunit HisH [Clostridia bacterium]|nr:imidazole glycerol phosphate synthase subunit HisH [Clostridia bacterium]
MLAIIDYGVGNIFSLSASLKTLGQDAVLTSDIKTIEQSDRIILPGVGAFRDAAEKLRETGMWDVVLSEAAKGKPILGICLGMQMLFDKSYEYGEYEGLGLISGDVVPISSVTDADLKIPHMGWNSLSFPEGKEKSRLYKYTNEGDYVYFVHSYCAANCESAVSAKTHYGADLTASAENGNVYGTQFHPEKSGNIGLKILKAFCEI